jgi:hypothetical protein
MEKQQFDEAELGENYKVIDGILGKYAELDNVNVRIGINITPLFLDAFYNRTCRKGIARCSLLWLLKKLLSDNLIKEKDVIIVSHPSANGGNDGRLERIYNEIGFYYEDDILTSSVEHLIETLSTQCAITTVQCAGKSSLRF